MFALPHEGVIISCNEVQDLVAILTVFSVRLPGLRSYRKVIRDAALQKDQAYRD